MFVIAKERRLSYEYMDSWERFNGIKLPDKKSFYSELKKEGITDEDYKNVHKV